MSSVFFGGGTLYIYIYIYKLDNVDTETMVYGNYQFSSGYAPIDCCVEHDGKGDLVCGSF